MATVTEPEAGELLLRELDGVLGAQQSELRPWLLKNEYRIHRVLADDCWRVLQGLATARERIRKSQSGAGDA